LPLRITFYDGVDCGEELDIFYGLNFFGKLGRDREGSGFHASGHIHGPGLEELVETIGHEILIPVHSESRDFFRRFEHICRVEIPEKGATLEIK